MNLISLGLYVPPVDQNLTESTLHFIGTDPVKLKWLKRRYVEIGLQEITLKNLEQTLPEA